MVENRNKDKQHARLYDLAFGLRPAEELYDLRVDPDQLNNVAADPKYTRTTAVFAKRLIEELKATDDPRAEGKGDFFDEFKYLGGAPKAPGGKKK
jgi:hypothetical protein